MSSLGIVPLEPIACVQIDPASGATTSLPAGAAGFEGLIETIPGAAWELLLSELAGGWDPQAMFVQLEKIGSLSDVGTFTATLLPLPPGNRVLQIQGNGVPGPTCRLQLIVWRRGPTS